jgi:hypothetical protein
VRRHEGDMMGIRGEGRSSLLAAPIALDLACARASAGRLGLAMVCEARDPWLAAGLAQRGARHGCTTIVLWDAGPGIGLALAGPDGDGTWFARGRAGSAVELEAWLAGAGVDGATLAVVERIAGGFAVAALPAFAAHAALRDLAAPGGPVATRWEAAEVARRQAGWYREGIAVARGEYDALADAGRALLLPHADEARVLPAGADPLKVF